MAAREDGVKGEKNITEKRLFHRLLPFTKIKKSVKLIVNPGVFVRPLMRLSQHYQKGVLLDLLVMR